MLQSTLQKNDKQAKWLIGIFSFVVFAAVVFLGNVKFDISVPFNVHIFAAANAVINSIIALLLIAALQTVKKGKYKLHKQLMIMALILSVIFLVSYIAHHLLAGEARYGDINHDGNVSDAEKAAVSGTRGIYFFILITHIFLASVILPFILYTAYKGLTGEFIQHKKISKYTWPLWLYVAITGPVVYFMISPYYR
jgi:putative membrane protein